MVSSARPLHVARTNTLKKLLANDPLIVSVPMCPERTLKNEQSVAILKTRAFKQRKTNIVRWKRAS